MSASKVPPEKPPIDSPIKSSDEDALGRSPIAHEFAKSIRELDASEGMVVGVLGAWGHGKSSFINLMKEQFEEKPTLAVVEFNPWMFSGSEQLVNFFFKEIGAQLSVRDERRFGKVADWLGEYAGILEPIGSFIPIPGGGFLGKVLGNVVSGTAKATRSEKTATQLRKEITAALHALDQPIVVVVDDIDRLTTPEIREIFKLVRLTASFPNVIYVLAFDRVRVETALTEGGVPGRAYLEKIVQLSFDVPQVPEKLLRSQTYAELDRVLGQLPNASLDESRWSDVYFEIVDPLLKNMRDVTRYAISARSTVRGIGSQVDLVDLLALEAVRVFRPEIVQSLSGLRSELTSIKGYTDRTDERAKNAVQDLLGKFPDDDGLIRNLIRHLFPAARQYIENYNYGYDSLNEWRKDHRVSHVDYLNLYLDRVVPDELSAFRAAETAFGILGNRSELDKYLRELKADQLEEVLQGLEVFERSFPTNAIVPASITLLNLIDSMPKNKAVGIFDLGRPDLSVGRVVLRMLRRIEDEGEREKLATDILKELDTYSSQLDFLTLIGYRDGAGHKLVSEAFAAQAESDFYAKVAKKNPSEPQREWDIFRVYWTLKDKSGSPPLKNKRDADLLLAVFNSAKSTNRSQGFDTRAVTLTDVLAWDLMVEVFGDEVTIKRTADIVRNNHPKAAILKLVDKYLGGWRPDKW
jgi:predicted KAP-like P-loop ATPase